MPVRRVIARRTGPTCTLSPQEHAVLCARKRASVVLRKAREQMRDGNGQPPSGNEDREHDSLRERLRIYESFDEVIAESMRRARGFLDEAAEMREKVIRELAEARQELEEEIAEARAKLREEIAEAREEIEAERHELVSIARTILHRSGSSGKSGAQAEGPIAEPEPVTPYPLDQRPAHEAEQEAALIPAPVTSQTPPAAVESTALESTEPPDAPQTPEEPNPAPGEVPDVSVAEAPEPAPVGDPEPVPPVIVEPAPEAATAEPEPVRTTIIVHGISRPAVATGLQRYLLAQPGVTAVEPREFAEGILRLQIHASTPIDDHLFAGWSDGAGMTVIQRVPRTVEVILPSAT